MDAVDITLGLIVLGTVIGTAIFVFFAVREK